MVKIAAIFPLLFISVASNLDNGGVGMAYGAQRIKVPPIPNLIIAGIAFAETLLAVAAGERLAAFLPSILTKGIGAAIIIAVGIWIMAQKPAKKGDSERDSNLRCQPLAQSFVPPAPPSQEKDGLNGFCGLLAAPEKADQDASGEISWRESLLLGQALAMNNVAQGVGAGFVGLSPFWVAATGALGSYLFLWAGATLANRYIARLLGAKAPLLAGFLLILVGLYQLY